MHIEKMGFEVGDIVVKRIIKARDGRELRIIADDMPKIIAAESIDDGNVYFFIEPTMKNGEINSKCIFSYTVTKNEFFTAIDEIVENKEGLMDDKDKLASELRHKYYKIPQMMIMLIVNSYLDSR